MARSATPYQSPANMRPSDPVHLAIMRDSLTHSLLTALGIPSLLEVPEREGPNTYSDRYFGRPGWSAMVLDKRYEWPTYEIEMAANRPLAPSDRFYAVSPKLALAMAGVHPNEYTHVTRAKRQSILYAGFGRGFDHLPPLPRHPHDHPDRRDGRKIRSRLLREVTRWITGAFEGSLAEFIIQAKPLCLLPPTDYDSPEYSVDNPKSLGEPDNLPRLTAEDLQGIAIRTGVPAHSFIRYAATDLRRRGWTYLSWTSAYRLGMSVGLSPLQTVQEAVLSQPPLPNEFMIGADPDDFDIKACYHSAMVELAEAMIEVGILSQSERAIRRAEKMRAAMSEDLGGFSLLDDEDSTDTPAEESVDDFDIDAEDEEDKAFRPLGSNS